MIGIAISPQVFIQIQPNQQKWSEPDAKILDRLEGQDGETANDPNQYQGNSGVPDDRQGDIKPAAKEYIRANPGQQGINSIVLFVADPLKFEKRSDKEKDYKKRQRHQDKNENPIRGGQDIETFPSLHWRWSNVFFKLKHKMA
ncbi:MAG: hypothetical protein IH901_05855 [Proteobacteria bacterium]|nr:hypothetical protein [Pseudomonadota bacterium]